MKIHTTILAIILFNFICDAQSVASYSIDSGGIIITNTNIKMMYTIGEVNIQEYVVGNVLLSEGFINSNIGTSTLGVDDENFLDDDINIFPNPVSDILHITTTIPIENIEFFDVLGKKVLSTKETAQIQIDHLSSGLYLLRVTTDQGLLVKKIIVE